MVFILFAVMVLFDNNVFYVFENYVVNICSRLLSNPYLQAVSGKNLKP